MKKPGFEADEYLLTSLQSETEIDWSSFSEFHLENLLIFVLERLKRSSVLLDQLCSLAQHLSILGQVDDLKKYFEMVEVQHFKEQQVIIAYNDIAVSHYCLAQGQASVMVPVEDDDQPDSRTHLELKRVLRKYDFFGEMGLLHGNRRTAEVVARTGCVVLVLNKGQYATLIERRASKEVEAKLSFFSAHLFGGQPSSSECKSALLYNFEPYSFQFHTHFIVEGAPCEYLYLLLEGEVEIVRRVHGQLKHISNLAHEGVLLGEEMLPLCSKDSAPTSSYSAYTKTESHFLRMSCAYLPELYRHLSPRQKAYLLQLKDKLLERRVKAVNVIKKENYEAHKRPRNEIKVLQGEIREFQESIAYWLLQKRKDYLKIHLRLQRQLGYYKPPPTPLSPLLSSRSNLKKRLLNKPSPRHTPRPFRSHELATRSASNISAQLSQCHERMFYTTLSRPQINRLKLIRRRA